jgi:O-antigen/teichoic acid export membrane protein
MLIASLVNQVNSNLDNIVVGAYLGSVEVAVYSTALTIFNMFSQIGSSVSSVMLPKVISLLKCGDVIIEDYVVKIGRIQFMLVGAALGAFIVLGKPFISLWMGDTFSDAYYITIILMIPAVFEICINVCLAVLRATNKLKYRTVVLVLMLVFNAFVTIAGVPKWGYFVAAIGTALSYVLGHVVSMGFYYRKEFGFHPIRAYRRIFSRTWICVLLSSVAALFTTFAFVSSLTKFLVGAIVFVLVYTVTLIIFLPKSEKGMIFGIFHKVYFHHRRHSRICYSETNGIEQEDKDHD